MSSGISTETKDSNVDDGADSAPALTADIQNHIGQRLKALYDGIVGEPVPDRFQRLLAELDAAEAQRSAGEAGSEPAASPPANPKSTVGTDGAR